MDGGSFTNDLGEADEPTCETPDEEEDGEPCNHYNEFQSCIGCKNGYKLSDAGVCELEDKDFEEEEEDDGETDGHEDVNWRACLVEGYNGWECPADSQTTC